MKFSVIYQQTSNNAQSPVRVVEQTSGRGISWINRYLDREYVRRLANTSLRTYAHNLLHFVRYGGGANHTCLGTANANNDGSGGRRTSFVRSQPGCSTA